MVDVCWKGALVFYLGKPMYARVTSVIMQALESSMKNVKAPILPQAILCYPVFRDGSHGYYDSPFIKKGVERRFLTKSKYLLHQPRVTECDEQCIDVSPFYGEDHDSSDEEIATTYLLVIPPLAQVSFIQDFWMTLPHKEKSKLGKPSFLPFGSCVIMLTNLRNTYQSLQLSWRFAKEKLHHFTKKNNKYQIIQMERNILAWHPAMSHMKNPELG
jgi:hypothetical protein